MLVLSSPTEKIISGTCSHCSSMVVSQHLNSLCMPTNLNYLKKITHIFETRVVSSLCVSLCTLRVWKTLYVFYEYHVSCVDWSTEIVWEPEMLTTKQQETWLLWNRACDFRFYLIIDKFSCSLNKCYFLSDKANSPILYFNRSQT